MLIERVFLRHFRNYQELNLDFKEDKNVFIGENASGKTNILEAFYYLSHGKSQRARHESEMVKWGESFATVKLEARTSHYKDLVSIEAQLFLTSSQSLKTQFKLNGKVIKNRSEVVGKIPTVTFFLPDLLMLRGAPEDRRNILDSCLVQYDPLHFKRIHLYRRIRQQKTGLLKHFSGSFEDKNLLDSLDQQLAQTGAELMQARINYLNLMEPLIEIHYHELSGGKDHLTLCYHSSFPGETGFFTVEDLSRQFYEAIINRRHEEQQRSQVLVGPHRDDIRFFINQKDATLFGSQGQQRTAVIAMKLAEIDILEKSLDGEMPILLFDDVMAELDPKRQYQLIEHVNRKMQLFLTTTHLDGSLKRSLDEVSFLNLFTISSGEVIRQQQATPLKGGEDCHVVL